MNLRHNYEFSVLSQEIGWEEHLQNDFLFGVEWYSVSDRCGDVCDCHRMLRR